MAFVTREVKKFDFDKPGACIEGRLVKYRETVFRESGKRGVVLLLANANGIHAIAKATDMEDKIFPSDVGSVLRIEYANDDEKYGTADRAMKRFRVYVDAGNEASKQQHAEGAPELTDQDVPY